MTEAPAMTAASAPGAIPEHSVVRLRRTLPKEGLKAGSKGAVVHVYEGGVAYEVEFLEVRARPCVITLSANDIEVAAKA